MPRDTIDKAIKMGTGEAGAERFEATRYEAFGPGGAALLIDLLISNANRTAAEIRTILDKNGGKMGVPGSVAFGFVQQGVIFVPKSAADEERVMEIVLACDAEDVSSDDDFVQVISKPTDFEKVRAGLEAAKLPIESAEIAWQPQTTIELDVEVGRKLLALIDAIEDHDDVQKVFHNADLPDDA